MPLYGVTCKCHIWCSETNMHSHFKPSSTAAQLAASGLCGAFHWHKICHDLVTEWSAGDTGRSPAAAAAEPASPSSALPAQCGPCCCWLCAQPLQQHLLAVPAPHDMHFLKHRCTCVAARWNTGSIFTSCSFVARPMSSVWHQEGRVHQCVMAELTRLAGGTNTLAVLMTFAKADFVEEDTLFACLS